MQLVSETYWLLLADFVILRFKSAISHLMLYLFLEIVINGTINFHYFGQMLDVKNILSYYRNSLEFCFCFLWKCFGFEFFFFF